MLFQKIFLQITKDHIIYEKYTNINFHESAKGELIFVFMKKLGNIRFRESVKKEFNPL